MLYGGMPRILFMEDEREKKEYLSSLYRELYIRDIVECNGIEREDLLGDILDYLASQIGRSISNPRCKWTQGKRRTRSWDRCCSPGISSARS